MKVTESYWENLTEFTRVSREREYDLLLQVSEIFTKIQIHLNDLRDNQLA